MRAEATVVALAIAGCGFELTAGGGGDDGVPEGTRITLTHDTAGDFTGDHVDADIAARGAIEPAAFVLGGLLGRGFTGEHVTATSTYDTVASAVGPLRGAAYRQVPSEWSATGGRPHGLGIAGGSSYTVLLSGEILLPPGPLVLDLHADDLMVLELALDGATFADRVVSPNGRVTFSLTVPAGGWYPIRASFVQGGGNAFWRLGVTPMGGARIPIDGMRLRKRLTASDRGLLVSAFDGKAMLTPRGESAVDNVDASYGNGTLPFDLPLTENDRFALRFAGQVRIDTAGSYTFSVDVGNEALDLFRIWVDGIQVARAWATGTDTSTATLDLAPGWHDLLLDYADETGNAEVELRLAGPGITAGPIAAERLRPAVAFGLTAPHVNFTTIPLADAGVVAIALPLSAPNGATIASVDYGYALANQRIGDLTIALLDCHGATTIPTPTVPAAYYYYSGDTSCAGTPVVPAAPWAWRITDSVPGNDMVGIPALYNPVLIATYWGGDRMPFAPAFTYTSAPIATAGAIALARITAQADLRGAALMLEMRTGADPAGLLAASWVPVTNDAVPALPASEWAQYRIAVTSDGWKLASIDKVELTYVVPAE